MLPAALLLAALAVAAAARPAAAARGLHGLDTSLPGTANSTAVEQKFLGGVVASAADDVARVAAGAADNIAGAGGAAAGAADNAASKLGGIAKDTGMTIAEQGAGQLGQSDTDSKVTPRPAFYALRQTLYRAKATVCATPPAAACRQCHSANTTSHCGWCGSS